MRHRSINELIHKRDSYIGQILILKRNRFLNHFKILKLEGSVAALDWVLEVWFHG